jgi:hypothetical protein
MRHLRLVAIVSLVVALLVGGIFWLFTALFPLPGHHLLAVEERLAGDDQVLQGHANLRALGFYRTLQATVRSQKASVHSEELLDRLEASSLPVGRKISDLLVTVHRSNEGYHAGWLVVGSFTRKEGVQFLKEELQRQHLAVAEQENGILAVGKPGSAICERGDYEIYVTGGLMLIARPADRHWLQSRLAGKGGAANADWLAFRGRKLSALQLTDLAALPALLPEGIFRTQTARWVADAKGKTGLVRGEIAPRLFPAGGDLLLQVAVPDASGSGKTVQAWLGGVVKEIPPVLSLLSPIIRGASVESGDGKLLLELPFSVEGLQHPDQLLTEIADWAVPAWIVPVVTLPVSSALPLDNRNFLPVYAAGKLPAFRPALSEHGFANAVAGPAAVVARRLYMDDDGITHLALEFIVQNVQNLSQQQARVKEVRIRDKSGRDMLPLEACGQREGEKMIALNQFRVVTVERDGKKVEVFEVSGSKDFTLDPYSNIENLGRIDMVFELDIPVKTVTQRIPAPVAGAVITLGNGRFYLASATGKTLQYRISGNGANLLAVRGIGKNGEVLPVLARNQQQVPGVPGLFVQEQFAEPLSAVEVVVATESKRVGQRLLVKSLLQVRENPLREMAAEFEVKTLPAHRILPISRLKADAFPFRVDSHFFVTLRTPPLDFARHNLSALELKVALHDAAGKLVDGSQQRIFLPLRDANGVFEGGGQLQPLPDGVGSEGIGPVASLKGQAVLRVPAEMVPVDVERLQLGEGWVLGDEAEIRYEELRGGANPVMVFSVKGEQQHFLQLQLLDSKGELLAAPVDPVQKPWPEGGEGARLLEFSLYRYPERMRLFYGKATVEFFYPVAMDL